MANSIARGTRIRLTGLTGRYAHMNGCTCTVSGEAHNWGTPEKPDWYLKLNVDGSGAGYLKQQIDGQPDLSIEIIGNVQLGGGAV